MIKKILKENWYYIVAILVLVIFFFLLKNSYFMDYIQKFDYKVMDYFSGINNKFLYPMIIITNIGHWYGPVILILILFAIFKNKIYFYLSSSFYAFAIIIAFLSKIIIERARPAAALIDMPSTYSFPSGHTLTSICFFVIFAYILTAKLSKTERAIYILLFTVLPLLIGLSRIYLSAHYFSDVIGGMIISIPCLMMFINIINKNFREVL